MKMSVVVDMGKLRASRLFVEFESTSILTRRAGVSRVD